MPQIVYQEGGSQRNFSYVYYQEGASQRNIIAAYYQDGATLRQIWPAAGVMLNAHSIGATRTGAGVISATFDMLNTGVAQGSAVGTATFGTGIYTPEWMLTGPASAYDVMWTNSGSAVTGSATGTWLNLATSRSWTLTAPPGIGLVQAIGTVQIRDASTLAVLATATIDLNAERL